MKFRNVDKKRLVLVVISVILMGFCISFLNKADMGTDPFTMFNLGMSKKLGLSFGNWQAIFNSVLFIIVLICSRNEIGWGTLANMFLVGYSADFFTWLNGLWIPDSIYDSLLVRTAVMLPTLILFVFVASTYIACDLGTSPYDAIPNIIAVKVKKVPFKVVRIIYDCVALVLGFALGSTLGIVSIIMAFTLGPVITWVRTHIIEKFL